jgi:PKD repeat protein
MKLAKILLIIAGILTLPFNVLSIPRPIHVEWEYQYNTNVAGFRLYHDNTLACETTDSSAVSMDCSVDATDGESWFTITTFLPDGTESSHSDSFSYIFSSTLKAVFTADTLSGESPLPVTFDATLSTGNIVSYEWLFGDGETGSGSIINHVFTTAGNYTVTLKTIDDTGAFDQEVASVAVTSPVADNTTPIAVISSSASVGEAPLQVQFDGTGSSDSEGSIISYQWDMGDGGTASGSQVTYTYSSTGSFNATLTVTDDGGLTNITSTPVIATEPPEGINAPPNAVISASTSSGYKPLTVSFNAYKSNDPDGTIASYTWNFGDGASASGVSVKHTFTQAAAYTVTLKVTDNNGASSQPAK